MAKNRYFILGEQASTFTCQKAGLDISNKNVGKVATKDFKNSTTCIKALRNGHIKEISEDEAIKLRKTNGQDEAEKQAAAQEALRKDKERKKLIKLGVIPKDGDEDEEDDEETDEDKTGDADTDDDEEEDDEDGDQDEDNNGMTKAQLIAAIKDSDTIDEKLKKGLTKKTEAELQALFDSGKK